MILLMCYLYEVFPDSFTYLIGKCCTIVISMGKSAMQCCLRISAVFFFFFHHFNPFFGSASSNLLNHWERSFLFYLSKFIWISVVKMLWGSISFIQTEVRSIIIMMVMMMIIIKYKLVVIKRSADSRLAFVTGWVKWRRY